MVQISRVWPAREPGLRWCAGVVAAMPDTDPAQLVEPVRVVSDVHLLHPGTRARSVASLEGVIAGAGTVVFNGDTFEQREPFHRVQWEHCQDSLRDLCAREGAGCLFIRGNHDPQAGDHQWLDLCGGEVWVTHGDVLYDDISPWSHELMRGNLRRQLKQRLADENDRIGDDLAARMQLTQWAREQLKAQPPRIHPGLRGRIYTVMAECWPPMRPFQILRVWTRSHLHADAVRQRFRPDARVVIHGHTHFPSVRRSNGVTVVNTGSFHTLSRPWVADIQGREMKVLRARNQPHGWDLSGGVIATVELTRPDLAGPVQAGPEA